MHCTAGAGKAGGGSRRGSADGAARNSRNLNAFVAGTTPRFERPRAAASVMDVMADSKEPRAPEAAGSPAMSDVWRYYDEPYGHEVPLVLEDGVESYAFYVPHLSAIQVYGRARGEGAEAPGRAGAESVKLLDYFETAKPNNRVPLLDRIGELDEEHEGVLTGGETDLDISRSWYSISWFPILCDQYTSHAVKGCFLTYHRFRAGPCPFAIDDDIREMGGPAAVAGAAGAAAAGSGDATCRFLSVCGLVPYKVREPTWEGAGVPAPPGAALAAELGMNTNCQLHEHPGLAELRSSADEMLSQSNVHHPDYLHFSRR